MSASGSASATAMELAIEELIDDILGSERALLPDLRADLGLTPEFALDASGHPSLAGPLAALRSALGELGVTGEAQELFVMAADTCGALATGRDLADRVPPDHLPADHPTGDDAAADHPGESTVGAPDRAVLQERGSRVLGRLEALAALGAHLESALVRTAGDLTVRTGRVLLAAKGLDSPADLSSTARARWAARARSTACAEIVAATSIGPGGARDLVGLATAPAPVKDVVTSAMSEAMAPWELTRSYYRAVCDLSHEDAAHVAAVLFGHDERIVAPERLTPEGKLSDAPWGYQEFRRALAREVAAVKSRDEASAQEARQRARERRRLRVKLHDDGSAQIIIDTTAANAVAVNDRIKRGAQRARGRGDERTVPALTSDLATSLLLHSVLNVPDLPDDPDKVTTEHTDQMTQVILALPSAVLDVIVPYSALVHSPNRPLASPEDIEALTLDLAGVRAGVGAAAGAGSTEDAASDESGAVDAEDALSLAKEAMAASLRGGADLFAAMEAAAAGLYGTAHPPDSSPYLAVGEVTGAHPYFLSTDEIRDLALQAGTTLNRLLVTIADGRCVERTMDSYSPDPLMRAQIHAADVTCRAPGCTQHATYAQLDHVVEYPEGPTSELNLQSASIPHHHLKTCKAWRAVMDPADRSVTWTTLLGRIYRTRVHDYRQYTRLHADAIARVEERTAGVLSSPDASDDAKRFARSDAIDQAIIEALAWRDPHQALDQGGRGGQGDRGGVDGAWAYGAWATTILTHTGPDGRRRTGPRPEVQRSERRRQQESR